MAIIYHSFVVAIEEDDRVSTFTIAKDASTKKFRVALRIVRAGLDIIRDPHVRA